MKPINLKGKHGKFSKQWYPHQIAAVDDKQAVLAKTLGKFTWRWHNKNHKLFQALKGAFLIRFKDRTKIVKKIKL